MKLFLQIHTLSTNKSRNILIKKENYICSKEKDHNPKAGKNKKKNIKGKENNPIGYIQ